MTIRAEMVLQYTWLISTSVQSNEILETVVLYKMMHKEFK